MLLYGKNPNNAFLQCINVLMFDAVALFLQCINVLMFDAVALKK